MLFPLWPFSVRAPSVATVLRQRTWPRPQTTGAKRSLSMLGECGRLSAAQCPSIVHSVLGGRDPVLGHTASTVARHHSGRRRLTPAKTRPASPICRQVPENNWLTRTGQSTYQSTAVNHRTQYSADPLYTVCSKAIFRVTTRFFNFPYF